MFRTICKDIQCFCQAPPSSFGQGRKAKRMEDKSEAFDVVVVGAGAIGVCTAYYLTSQGVGKVAVVEKTGVACAASGKAGGFLALDWGDGGPLQELARKSFQLHAELAEQFGNPWEYRRLNTIAIKHFTRQKDRTTCKRAPWVDGASEREQVLGSPDTTAQVTPVRNGNTVLCACACARVCV